MLLFIDFSWIDILDIFLVAVLIYQLYKLVKGTVAIKIFFGIMAIYLLWKLVSAFQMEMLSEILGQFIGVGVIALIIVFQQELRQFLLFIGSRDFFENKKWMNKLLGTKDGVFQDYSAVFNACNNMAKTKTGALIIIAGKSDTHSHVTNDVTLNAKLSTPLLESIFYKNSPLHDGAALVRNQRIISARGVLPVSDNISAESSMGMRHRAALGLTELIDATVITVSEQTGGISYAYKGTIYKDVGVNVIKEHLIKNG